MVQAVGRRHKPFHVRRKAQLVGVQDAAHGALDFGGFGVDESERIRQRIGHNHRLFVRRQVKVVRLFAGGNAFGFRPRLRVDDADAGIQRVEDKHRGGDGGRSNCPACRQGGPGCGLGLNKRYAWQHNTKPGSSNKPADS